MISVKNLTKKYKVAQKEKGIGGFVQSVFNRKFKEVAALKDVSFEIGVGEFVGLIGPNGAGKTTTMKILSGILYPTAGDVSVLGYEPFEKKYEFLRQIAFVMGQKNQLIWDLPAMDTFLLNKETYEIDEKDFKKRLDELTDLLQCKEQVIQQVRTLSLGQRMKMEFIAAVLHQPKILFLDEPTIGLDVIAQKTIRDFIKEYQRRYKATIILTSHYMEDVKQLAHRVMIINQGDIIYDGNLASITKRYAKHKRISVILEKEVPIETLRKINKDYTLEFPRVTFNIPRDQLNKKVQEISSVLPFEDINIEEERIEDVIRKIFQGKKA